MTKAEKELEEMKCFATSAGCMTIEHVSTAIRRTRMATSPSEVRHFMEELKHFTDILVEDFNYNFPNRRKDNGKHIDKE